jgi:hypothetical protein
MKKTELILFACFYVSMSIAFLHIPLGRAFFVVISSSLCIAYFAFGFPFINGLTEKTMTEKNAFSNLTLHQIIPSAIATFSFTASIVAIMFKVQMWPMSSVLFLLSFATLVISFILALVLSKGKQSTVSKNILIRFVFITIPAIVFFLTPELTIASLHYRDEPAIYEAYKNVLEHPGDTTYINQLHKAKGTVIPPERNSK